MSLQQGHCWLVFNLVSTRSHRSFPDKLLSGWVDPSIYCCWELFLSRCRTLYFSLLNFVRFLSAHLSIQLRSSIEKASDPYSCEPLLQDDVKLNWLVGEHLTIHRQSELHDTRPSWQSESWMSVSCRELMVWDSLKRKKHEIRARCPVGALKGNWKLEKSLAQKHWEVVYSSSASMQ